MKMHQILVNSKSESTEYEKRKAAFEKAAKKKDYSLDKDNVDRYKDICLQEAWEIFNLIDLKEIDTL